MNSLTPAEFERDVIAGEGPLPERKWFRYPMLHTGTTRAVRDEVYAWLAKRGYRNGVVTLDSEQGAGRIDVLLEIPRGLELVDGANPVAFRLRDGETRDVRFRLRCARWGGYRVGRNRGTVASTPR